MWRRNNNCPPVDRQSQRLTTGSHSISLRPPTPMNARAAQSSSTGTTYIRDGPPPK